MGLRARYVRPSPTWWCYCHCGSKRIQWRHSRPTVKQLQLSARVCSL